MKEILELIKRWIKLLGVSGINSKQIVLDEMKAYLEKVGNEDGTN
jgi:hypothetical protein